MLYNSLEYAIFLPIVFILYWLIPKRFRWVLLLVSSLYFYMSWNAKYVVLILFSMVVSYSSALLIEKIKSRRRRKWVLGGALALCFGVLFTFKYFDFFSESLNALFSMVAIPLHPVTLKLVLPVGISFYTFQTVSYVIDVYRGEPAERHFGYYATYISFFPQLVAGPIERSSALLPQLKAGHDFDYDKATYGLKLFAWGLAKKVVVADNLAQYVDFAFSDIRSFSGFSLWVAIIMFAFQIYCDFSGYSDMARGSANLFGIELMDNFRSPYFSTSIKEFWSRWHISLSTWFRDYVYIPLGGNRKGKVRTYINLLVTFLASGLWHGANWTFVVWGGLHGLAQVGEKALKIKKETKTFSVRWFLRVGVVFCFVTLAWTFFRAQSISDAFYVLRHLFDGISDPIEYIKAGPRNLRIYRPNQRWRVIGCMAPLIFFDLISIKTDPIKWVGKQRAIVRYPIYLALILYLLFMHAIVQVDFVYFQF